MKKLMIVGGIFLGIAILTYSVTAQQSTSAARSPVALVDMNYILRQNARLEVEIRKANEDLSQKIKNLEPDYAAFEKQYEQLGMYDKGSTKYRELEQILLTRRTELDLKRQGLLREGAANQLKIYRAACDNVMMHTKRVAEYFGMYIVFNHEREIKMNENPDLTFNLRQFSAFIMDQQMRYSGRNVVWANSGSVDITTLVLAQINQADPSTIRKDGTGVAGTTAPTAGAVGNQATTPRR